MSLVPRQLSHSDLANALHLSQQAPALLATSAPSSDLFPLSLLNTPENSEIWAHHEQLFYACLQTEDNRSAFLLLERLIHRFGAGNERIMGLKGLYQEAVARDEPEIREVLQEYTKILSEHPMNVFIHKRRIALIRATYQPEEAITALVEFLEIYPTDAEAWCELADLYQSQGMSSQAIFSFEEALISAPFAWNIHARLGELAYVTASSNTETPATSQQLLVDAIQRFSRSVELCNDYLRGYYGLQLATSKLLQTWSSPRGNASETMSRETAQRMKDMSLKKLKSIVSKRAGQPEPDVIAAKALLDAQT